MIDVYFHTDTELLTVGYEIDLSLDDKTIYSKCKEYINADLNSGGDFRILAIQHEIAFIRNACFFVTCREEYQKVEREKIFKEWLVEFRTIFGNFKDMPLKEREINLSIFSEELENRLKPLDDKFEEILKYYGIEKETRFERKVRGIRTS